MCQDGLLIAMKVYGSKTTGLQLLQLLNVVSNWYGWNPKHPVGSISTTLYGNGRAKLDFGNCEGGQNIRFVKVYLDGTEIDSAPNSTPSKSTEFDFTDGSVLKISEHNESILQFNSLEIICE